MTITIYQNTSDTRRVSKDLQGATNFECNIKRETNISNPTIEIQSASDLRQYNYVYIPLYKRYYYATVSAGPNNVYTFTCKCDVLMSFKGSFLPKQAIIKRSASLFNLYMDDGHFYISSKMRRQVKAFSGALTDPGDSYILVTA